MLDREQLARIVHDAINRMEDFDPVGEELLHVQPWAFLDDRQKEYCARVGEAVKQAMILDSVIYMTNTLETFYDNYNKNIISNLPPDGTSPQSEQALGSRQNPPCNLFGARVQLLSDGRIGIVDEVSPDGKTIDVAIIGGNYGERTGPIDVSMVKFSRPPAAASPRSDPIPDPAGG